MDGLAAFLFSAGTSDPASLLAADATDSTVENISVWLGADLGLGLLGTQAVMPYGGFHYYTSFDSDTGRDVEDFGSVSYGITGYLFDMLVYQVGARMPVTGRVAPDRGTTPFASIGIQVPGL